MLTINQLNAYNQEEDREDTLYYVQMLSYRKDYWSRGIKECETTDGVYCTTNILEEAKRCFEDLMIKHKDELVEIYIQQADCIDQRNVLYTPIQSYSKFEEIEKENKA